MKYSFFEESIHHHTRAQAVANGEQVEVSSIASQASIPFPVFLTRRVFDAYVTLPPNGRAPTPEHDAARRLSDILWMLHVAMLDKTAKGRSRLAFTLPPPFLESRQSTPVNAVNLSPSLPPPFLESRQSLMSRMFTPPTEFATPVFGIKAKRK